MSTPSEMSCRQPPDVAAEKPHLPSEVRFDAPHAPGCTTNVPTSGPSVETNDDHNSVVSGPPVNPGELTSLRQLHTQAVQLAEHLAVRQEELDRREAELNARTTEFEASLQSARQWFVERESDIDKRRERWLADRREAQKSLDTARRQLDEQRRREWADLAERRLAVQRRSEEVDRAWLELRDLHDEIGRIHRESLELRLVNEEFLARFADTANADGHRQTLKQLQEQVAAEFRRAADVLVREQQNLLAIRRDLGQEYRRLLQERQRLARRESPRQSQATA